MRYASRGDSTAAQPLHISIDALLEEARQIERAKVLLEVRQEIGAVQVWKGGSFGYGSDARRGDEVRTDILSIIDRKLA